MFVRPHTGAPPHAAAVVARGAPRRRSSGHHGLEGPRSDGPEGASERRSALFTRDDTRVCVRCCLVQDAVNHADPQHDWLALHRALSGAGLEDALLAHIREEAAVVVAAHGRRLQARVRWCLRSCGFFLCRT